MAGPNQDTPRGIARNLPPPPFEVEQVRALIESAGGLRKSNRLIVRRAVFDLWTTGYSEASTAQALGLSPGQVSRLLADHSEFWREYAGQEVLTHMGEQLARLDRAEREAWMAWERSKYPEEKSRRKIAKRGGATIPGKDGQPDRQVAGRSDDETVVDARGRDGDPRYLAIVVRIQQLRNQLIAGDGSGGGKRGDRLPGGVGGKGERIYPEELWGNRDFLGQTQPLLEAYLGDPSTLPNDGSGVPKPPDIDDPAYAPPAPPVSAVVELKPRSNGNGAASDGASMEDDDDEGPSGGGDDDDFGF